MVETDGLLLRQFQDEDWLDVLEYGSQTQVAKAANFTALRTKKDAISFQNILRRDGIWAIEEKVNNKVIGNIGSFKIIKPNGLLEKSGYEVGYALNQNFWGRGLMTKVLRKFCDLEKKRGTLFLQARVYSDNLASCKVLQNNGFKLQSQREVFDVFLPNKKISELYYVKILIREIERSENNAVDERF